MVQVWIGTNFHFICGTTLCTKMYYFRFYPDPLLCDVHMLIVCLCVLYCNRLCSLTLTRLILLKPLEAELQSIIIAVKMQVCVMACLPSTKYITCSEDMLLTSICFVKFVIAADHW